MRQTTSNQEERNKRVVTALYEDFNSKNDAIIFDPNLFAPYLEWWFHGPPFHQHLKRLLTGSSPNDLSFPFVPFSVVAFESTVIAEGCDQDRTVSWVHAWTLGADGKIAHVREYYNTSVTVTRLGSADVASRSTYKCQSVWQSKLCDASVPGLVLAL